MTVGQHGGVMYVHGLPLTLTDSEFSKFDVMKAKNQKTDEKVLLRSIEDYIKQTFHLEVTIGSLSMPAELVWHMSKMSSSNPGVVSLAYYVQGSVSPSSSSSSQQDSFVSFDAFVEVNSLFVVHFIKTSGQFKAISPFKSPISDAHLYIQPKTMG